MIKPALYMIPVPIADGEASQTIPAGTMDTALQLRKFIVENLRTARRTLKRFSSNFPIEECEFFELNGHTDPKDIPPMLVPLRNGEAIGVMSEAGCPGVADPGADVVAIAQREGFEVVPLVGPSSILMALMASGFNGQGFAFQGYLPIDKTKRQKRLRELESISSKTGQTQIFIETPYRNDEMLRCLVETLHPSTLLCIACNISGRDGFIKTHPVSEWKKADIKIGKRPSLFLFNR